MNFGLLWNYWASKECWRSKGASCFLLVVGYLLYMVYECPVISDIYIEFFFLPKLIFILGLVLDIVEVLLLRHAISV